MLLLQWMLRWFRFGYKTPVLYVVAALLALTVVSGLALDRATGLNDRFLGQADEHRLPPPFGDFYGGARRMPPPGNGFCRCVITAISGDSLSLKIRATAARPQ